MNDGFVENTLHWFATPEELREIAQRMEEKYKNAKPGDPNVVKHIEITWSDGIAYCIDIHYDQERMQ